jgi:hypothetical protein
VAEELAYLQARWFIRRSQLPRQRSASGALGHAHFRRLCRERVPGDKQSYSFSANSLI